MTPTALIEQELAAAEAARHDSNDGKARVCARRAVARATDAWIGAIHDSTMARGCYGTSPTHSAGRILPSSYPPGGRAIEYRGNPSAHSPLHDRPGRRRETPRRATSSNLSRKPSPGLTPFVVCWSRVPTRAGGEPLAKASGSLRLDGIGLKEEFQRARRVPDCRIHIFNQNSGVAERAVDRPSQEVSPRVKLWHRPA